MSPLGIPDSRSRSQWDRPGTGLVDVMDQNIEGIVIKLGMNSARDARLNFIDVPCQRLSSQ